MGTANMCHSDHRGVVGLHLVLAYFTARCFRPVRGCHKYHYNRGWEQWQLWHLDPTSNVTVRGTSSRERERCHGSIREFLWVEWSRLSYCRRWLLICSNRRSCERSSIVCPGYYSRWHDRDNCSEAYHVPHPYEEYTFDTRASRLQLYPPQKRKWDSSVGGEAHIMLIT